MKDFSLEVLQQIDNYVMGTLSAVEKTQFETAIASDVELQKEVEFQQDLIEQLNNREAIRIKSHLNTVPVSTTPALLSTKWLIGYAAVGLIGVGAFLYNTYTEFDNNPNKEAVSHDLTIDHKNYYENQDIVTAADEAEVTSEEVAVNNPSNTLDVAEANIEEGNEIASNNISSDVQAPGFVDMNDTDDQGVSTDNQAPEISNELKAKNENRGLDVELDWERGKKRGTLRYRFANEKLFMYNITPEMMPYTIYEKKTHFGNEYYIEIKKRFYRLDQTQTVKTEMEEVTNPSLIEDLKK